jgi:hypothetical protein
MINKPLNVYQLSMINKERYILNSDEIKKVNRYKNVIILSHFVQVIVCYTYQWKRYFIRFADNTSKHFTNSLDKHNELVDMLRTYRFSYSVPSLL